MSEAAAAATAAPRRLSSRYAGRAGCRCTVGPLGFVSEGIADERREANRIKAEQPILAIIGNPPYRRLEEGENRTLVGDWMDHLWDDLKEPVRNAGQGDQLNTFPELSVAFWRWAIWKTVRGGERAETRCRRLHHQSQIPDRLALCRPAQDDARTFRPHRDHRPARRCAARRARPASRPIKASSTSWSAQQSPLAIADGSKAEGQAADVYYQDSWTDSLFSRRAKIDWLVSRADAGTPSNAVAVERGLLDDMRPMPFLNGELVSLRDCFSFYRSGLQTKRDDLVYDPSMARLQRSNQSFPFGR